MLSKTKLQFKEDVKEMWLSYIRYQRSMNTVTSIFTKNVLPYPCEMELISLDLFQIKLNVDTVDLNDTEMRNQYEEQFQEIRNFLKEIRCQHAWYSEEFTCVVSIDNFVEAILTAENL